MADTGRHRIAWVEDSDAQGEIAEIFARAKAASPRKIVPDIYRTMSWRPDFLNAVITAASALHFSDGYLTRAQHEMIASYVSALNRCHY